MSKSKIYISRCDRCGEETRADAEHDSVFYDWGYIWYAQQNGPFYLKIRHLPKSTNEMVDLCPECMTELNEWYNKPKTGKF